MCIAGLTEGRIARFLMPFLPDARVPSENSSDQVLRSLRLMMLAIAVVSVAGGLILHSLVPTSGLPASVRAYLRDIPFVRAGVQPFRFAADILRSNSGPFPGTRVRRAISGAANIVPGHFSAPPHRDTSPPPSPCYPLAVSANSRYLVDQCGTPFLVVGDSPQAMIGNLTLSDVELFLANRKAAGFNSVWINLLCNNGTGCNRDGTTFDGIAPFLVLGDLSTPNEAYFSRADQVLRLAHQHDIAVFLNPLEMIGWLEVLKDNGATKGYHYGLYVGNRYRNLPNVVWMTGNDFQTWADPHDGAVLRAVAQGIRDADPHHIHTVHLNYVVSASMDDPAWLPLIEFNAVYTYRPTYAKVLQEYSRANYLPVLMVEASYEFEGIQFDFGTPELLRRQEYWSMLSGAAGQFYGNRYTWPFVPGWQAMLDTVGSIQMRHLVDLLAPRRWYDLVPDRDHFVVTEGYGTFTDTGREIDSDYLTAARTADGTLVLAYMPTSRTIAVDMTSLAQPSKARWYDPTNGAYIEISDSLLENTGTKRFVPPAENSDGDGDWVLVLEASPAASDETPREDH